MTQGLNEMEELVPEEDVIKLLKAKCDELGLREFCRQTGIDPGNLSNVLRGHRPLQMRMGQVVGYEPVFRWRKANDDK